MCTPQPAACPCICYTKRHACAPLSLLHAPVSVTPRGMHAHPSACCMPLYLLRQEACMCTPQPAACPCICYAKRHACAPLSLLHAPESVTPRGMHVHPSACCMPLYLLHQEACMRTPQPAACPCICYTKRHACAPLSKLHACAQAPAEGPQLSIRQRASLRPGAAPVRADV